MRSFLAAALLIALLISPGCNADKSKSSPATNITTDADQVLRQMSQKLGSAARLSFKASRKLDAGLIEGRELPESSQVLVSVVRPEMLMAKSSSGDGVRYFYADGENISLFDETMKLYTTAPLKGTIDDVAVALDERYGFTPPLIEFVVSDSYKKFSQHIQSSSSKGRENINGLDCHRLSLVGKIADSELWISAADYLPRKLIATFKDRENQPKLEVEFSEWDLNPELDKKLFTFSPPKDAEKIAMVSTQEMKQAAAKETKEKP